MYRVGAGSGPGVALLAGVAIQRVIRVLPVLYRLIMHQFSHTFSALAYGRRVPDCVPVFPGWGSILESYERMRLGHNADDTMGHVFES